MGDLPTGTVTLLFTDIEGSTSLLQELGRERFAEALVRHRELLRQAFAERGGYEVDYEGDAFFVAFQGAAEAVVAAATAQQALAAEEWPGGHRLRVRMGIHTGEPLPVPPKYVGLDVHRAARIMAAAHGGQVLLSERTASLVEEQLSDGVSIRELGEHRLKDLSDPQRIYQLVIKELPSEFPPLKTLGNRATNLPVQPNRLIGREDELASITATLRGPETRLLTLTGPGGTGKTRLALQASAEVVDDFTDGVFAVFLASISDPDLVLDVVAQTLGLRDQPTQTLEQALLNYLGERELLLVLDNFEHLLAAAPAVSRLLARAAHLSVIATSREALRIGGERCFDVSPLPTPAETSRHAVAALANDAVALFVERARAADNSFELTDENAAAVAEVCTRLDGLPLALELAAARTRALSPEALRRRLDQSLALLTGGARDVDERQQTLRATIEWSYELLSEDEKKLFARLAVFRGGCRPETAEAVCAAEGERATDVLGVLASLVEKSLLRQRDDADGEPRFWMLETIREYALERLTELSEEESVRQQHAKYFSELAYGIAPTLKTRDQLSGMQRLNRDYDNLRAALEWLVVGDVCTAVALAAALAGYWRRRGLVAEGREWLERVLSVTNGCSETTAGLIGAGELALAQTDYAGAEGALRKAIAAAEAEGDKSSLALGLVYLGWALSAHEETSEAESCGKRSASLFRELGDPWGRAHALLLLEALAYYRGNFEDARRLSEENLACARQAGDPEVESEGLATAATIARYMGEYARALNLGEHALALARALENPYAISNTLRFVAPSARLSGDAAKAEAYAREALELSTEIGEQLVVATAKFHLALALADQGHDSHAETLLLEALEQCVAMGDKSGVAACFARLAVLSERHGHRERAGRLFGAAENLREMVNSPAPPSDRAELKPVIDALRRELGEERALEAWAEGSAMTYENAIQYALLSRH